MLLFHWYHSFEIGYSAQFAGIKDTGFEFEFGINNLTFRNFGSNA